MLQNTHSARSAVDRDRVAVRGRRGRACDLDEGGTAGRIRDATSAT